MHITFSTGKSRIENKGVRFSGQIKGILSKKARGERLRKFTDREGRLYSKEWLYFFISRQRRGTEGILFGEGLFDIRRYNEKEGTGIDSRLKSMWLRKLAIDTTKNTTLITDRSHNRKQFQSNSFSLPPTPPPPPRSPPSVTSPIKNLWIYLQTTSNAQ